MHINDHTYWRIEAKHYNERFKAWLSLLQYVRASDAEEALRLGRAKMMEQYPNIAWEIVSVMCKRPLIRMKAQSDVD